MNQLSDVTLGFLLQLVSSSYAWHDEIKLGKHESWGLYLNAIHSHRRYGVREHSHLEQGAFALDEMD